MYKRIITLLSLILAIQAQAFITVGADDFCDYDNIQEAIDFDEDDIIRIARNQIYFENIQIPSKSIELVGGYADCFQAEMNITDQSQAVITANGVDSAVLLEAYDNDNVEVILRNLFISNGDNSIMIHAQQSSVLNVTLDQVRVYNSHNRGIHILGFTEAQAHVLINDSQIDFNQGGGIHCTGSSNTLNITGETLITENKAIGLDGIGNSGGGILVRLGCSLSVYSPAQIINNEATFGGGIAAINNSIVLLIGYPSGEQNGMSLGEWENPILLSENKAHHGGAFFAFDHSLVAIYNSLIENNQASFNGGAIHTLGNSIVSALNYQEPGQTCWSPGACLQFKGNKSPNGGAISSTDQSRVDISGALFTENWASSGIISRAYEGGNISIMNSIISNNGQNGAGDFSDYQLFDNQSGNDNIAKTELHYVTVVDNHTTDNLITNTEGSVAVYSSIILDDTVDVYQEAGQQSQFHIECSMVRENASFIAGPVVSVTNDDLETIFTNPAAGNYHLADDSPAIDYCYNASGISSHDIDGDTRGVDNFDMVNFEGTYDIGADETGSVSDLIFKDDFE